MEFEDLITLIKTVSESKLTGFKYEEKNVKIHLSKTAGQVLIANTEETVSGEAAVQVKTKQPVLTADSGMEIQADDITEFKNESGNESENIAESISDNAAGNIIESPLVGTFYTAASEDTEPFVVVGDAVKKGQTLAIVEAMKLMNEIESDYDGIVTQILVKNGEPVQYGQPLFRIS